MSRFASKGITPEVQENFKVLLKEAIRETASEALSSDGYLDRDLQSKLESDIPHKKAALASTEGKLRDEWQEMSSRLASLEARLKGFKPAVL